jgi:hypothetical protein
VSEIADGGSDKGYLRRRAPGFWKAHAARLLLAQLGKRKPAEIVEEFFCAKVFQSFRQGAEKNTVAVVAGLFLMAASAVLCHCQSVSALMSTFA